MLTVKKSASSFVHFICPSSKMFIDLNVPFSPSGFNSNTQQTAKQKQKQKQRAIVPNLDVPNVPILTANDLDSINSRLDMIAHRQ